MIRLRKQRKSKNTIKHSNYNSRTKKVLRTMLKTSFCPRNLLERGLQRLKKKKKKKKTTVLRCCCVNLEKRE